MPKLDKLIAWRKNKDRKMADGIKLLKDLDSRHIPFLSKNVDAKKGTYPRNLLDARVDRFIRILSQDSKKKEDTPEETVIKTQEEIEEEKQEEQEAEAKQLMSLAKAAQTRADKKLEELDKETDPKKKEKLEAKAEEALMKAEDAMKIAAEASEKLEAE